MRKENWTYRKVKEVCDKASSNIVLNKVENNVGDYALYGASGFVKGVDFFHREEPYIGIVKDGSGVGRVDVFPAKSSLVGTMQYILPKKDCLLKYLCYVLQSLKLADFVTGAAIPHIYFRDYGECVIPVPPLATQSQIVSELDLLQSLIDKQKAQLKELDNLAQAIFYDMFGDPITNTKGWEKCELNKNVEEMFLGPFGSSLKVDSYVDKGSSYCMVYEQKHAIQAKMDFEDTHYINEEKCNSLKRFTVVGGDFIMSCRGTIGRIFQLPLDAPLGIIHPSLMKIRIKNSYSPVFFKFLLTKTMEEQVTNGNCVQMAITAKELGKKHLVLPPLSLQQSFAQKVESIERQKELINQSIREAQTLFDSRMEYYFGE